MELNEIKKHKGKLIMLTYNGKNVKNQTGIITAVTKDYCLFKANGEFEKPILKDNIKEIKQIFTYSHYARSIKRYLSQNNPQKALDLIDECKCMFKLIEQQNELKKLSLDCIEILWKEHRTF